MTTPNQQEFVRWFEDLNARDVPIVGGKNASLGEMIRSLKTQGIHVPDGFAITANAYRKFIDFNHLTSSIQQLLEEFEQGKKSLEETGKTIRRLILHAHFPEDLREAILSAYTELGHRFGVEHLDVAVRSSATAEDLPTASFAGQQETFLNISTEVELLSACHKCFASLFTDRAISYRQAQSFDHMKVALSIGIQKMVRSDKASSGVIFTLDTETGFPDVVVINGAWGLGELVVQGAITPDQYTVYKPLLQDKALKPIVEKMLGTKEKKMVYGVGSSHTTKIVDTTSEERRSFVRTMPKSSNWLVGRVRLSCIMDDRWTLSGPRMGILVNCSLCRHVRKRSSHAWRRRHSRPIPCRKMVIAS